MNKPMILIVEDEPAIADTIQYAVESEGMESIWVATAADAQKAISTHSIDLIILDVGLPDKNGFDLCRELKPQVTTPIIFLTARDDVIDKVVGLELGADDYISKPFSPRELSARVKVVLRRTQSKPAEETLTQAQNFSDSSSQEQFDVKEEECQILYKGKTLELSKQEYIILNTFIKRPQKVFSREELMMQAWEVPESSMDRTIDTHIKNLRKKMKEITPEGDPIRTHRGLGYSLQEKEL
ncbi:two-component system response regulator CreB [bacterium]|nr:two-component system response regulator CreB [bacterium]